MPAEHNLFSVQERRKNLPLVFLFKVVEGSVPPIPFQDYLIPQRPKRVVHVRTFKDHVTSNIPDSQVNNNSRCFLVPLSKSEPCRHSFFVKTITDWIIWKMTWWTLCRLKRIQGMLSNQSVLSPARSRAPVLFLTRCVNTCIGPAVYFYRDACIETDPIPAWRLKECFFPYPTITNIKLSLTSG